MTSAISDIVAFVSDLREVLRQQGLSIDRQEVKPLVRELNTAVLTLRGELVTLKRAVEGGNINDASIVSQALALSGSADKMMRAVKALFDKASPFDMELERYRVDIVRLASTRAGTVEGIRIITITPIDGRINRAALLRELTTAIQQSDLLLPAVQVLAEELG
ncbi:MAG: hypothetical protein AAF289_11985 [Cyanobacteria bacterium P01_A01_bin.135]